MTGEAVSIEIELSVEFIGKSAVGLFLLLLLEASLAFFLQSTPLTLTLLPLVFLASLSAGVGASEDIGVCTYGCVGAAGSGDLSWVGVRARV